MTLKVAVLVVVVVVVVCLTLQVLTVFFVSQLFFHFSYPSSSWLASASLLKVRYSLRPNATDQVMGVLRRSVFF
jgi:hypothetical protein